MARKSDNTALNTLASNLNSSLLDNALESATITFAAGTTGSATAHAFATVTGVVAMQCFAVVGTDVTGAGSIEVGMAGTTEGVLAKVTGTTLDAGEIWHDATVDAKVELVTVLTVKIVTGNVIYTVSGGTLDSGTVKFFIRWSPISSDGNVVMAI